MKIPSSARAGARNRYGVAVSFRVIGRSVGRFTPARPWGRAGVQEEDLPRYLMAALAAVTASVRAFCAGTLLKIACSTAFFTISLTSDFLGTNGTMSW